MKLDFDVIIIGGGAAGFFAAIHIVEANPNLKVAILERGKEVLTKVKVSGGGRCNVTHAEFVPSELVKNYPRGEKELLGPFHTYCSGDIVAFFDKREISLKIEDDGRIFPASNSSQTIIDCFVSETERLGVRVLKNSSVVDFYPNDKKDTTKGWTVVSYKKSYTCKKVLITTGSNPKIWNKLAALGHHIEPPVASLFTFNIKDPRIEGIQGVSTNAHVQVKSKSVASNITIKLRSSLPEKQKLESEGPLLITHWGMSGPAILKLSAWGAKILSDYKYNFKIVVNWLPDYYFEGILATLMQIKDEEAKKTILRTKAFDIPRRLWISLVKAAGFVESTTWADASKSQLQLLADQLGKCEFQVEGKSTFKDEFVTAGGVQLKEVNFKTFESKKLPSLYFAGEVLNIDAITGGFNFQNAWTGGYIAAQAIAE